MCSSHLNRHITKNNDLARTGWGTKLISAHEVERLQERHSWGRGMVPIVLKELDREDDAWKCIIKRTSQ